MERVRIAAFGTARPLSLQVEFIPGHTVILSERNITIEVSGMERVRIAVRSPARPLSLQVDVIPGHTVILTERNITI